jgi:hypothetical protein
MKEGEKERYDNRTLNITFIVSVFDSWREDVTAFCLAENYYKQSQKWEKRVLTILNTSIELKTVNIIPFSDKSNRKAFCFPRQTIFVTSLPFFGKQFCCSLPSKLYCWLALYLTYLVVSEMRFLAILFSIFYLQFLSPYWNPTCFSWGSYVMIHCVFVDLCWWGIFEKRRCGLFLFCFPHFV